MPKTRQLSELRTEVRNRGEIRTAYVPDAELNRIINVAYNDYYSYIVSINPDWYVSEASLSVVSGTAAYSLSSIASDYWQLIGCDVLDGSDYYKLVPFNFSERNRPQDTGNKRGTRYRVMGSNLRLSPTPNWSGTVRVWYIPAPATLTADTDTVDGVAGWEEYIVLHALIQYSAKSEEDSSLHAAQLGAIKEQIKQLAGTRHEEDADTVRDITEERVYPAGYQRLPWP